MGTLELPFIDLRSARPLPTDDGGTMDPPSPRHFRASRDRINMAYRSFKLRLK